MSDEQPGNACHQFFALHLCIYMYVCALVSYKSFWWVGKKPTGMRVSADNLTCQTRWFWLGAIPGCLPVSRALTYLGAIMVMEMAK